ncbi:MAG: Ni/Fe hydrogenase subunit gamma [DPANN group archaeon]|nr:Ni/Fe hydrogenase subunit gamma [DPANN group archaeon]
MTNTGHSQEENPLQPRPYRVREYYRETPDTFTLTIDMAVDHDPGQFVQVSLPGIGESPISICSDSRKFIKLNIREVGRVTRELAGLRKGDTVFLRGPYGKGYPMEQLRGNDLIIVGGGCGIAPLKGTIDYIENHREAYGEVNLFIGYRSPKDIIFSRELEEWQQKYHLHVMVDQNPAGEFCYDGRTGFVTEAIREKVQDNRNKVVFICGPPVMMRAVIGILQEKGFNDDQIFVSAERLMFCAIGVCCHCMIKGKFTCIDGPVFRYDQIKEDEQE